MVITLKEQVIIKEWNKKGLVGLRVSSLVLLENIGGKNAKGIGKMLMRHTIRSMPEGLWDKAKQYCREICFFAEVAFSEGTVLNIMEIEKIERKDEGFD